MEGGLSPPRRVRPWRASGIRPTTEAEPQRAPDASQASSQGRQGERLSHRAVPIPSGCPRIAKLIERKFGVGYHVDHLPRLLRGLGFSCQKPTRRAKERDAEAIRRWVAVDRPRIKKRRRVSGPTSSSSTKRD
ncbi:MAG: winged helix-turn-helix domain-containing protein [Planctomycetes bacterium]|nr:winged helix-turn-helix domain-containing protein [Planctomycetota bacterium]